MKEVLVIGGAGFVGSHSCDSLSEAGYKVTIFDKVESQWIREDQKMIIGDMMDDVSLVAAMKNKDYVNNFSFIKLENTDYYSDDINYSTNMRLKVNHRLYSYDNEIISGFYIETKNNSLMTKNHLQYLSLGHHIHTLKAIGFRIVKTDLLHNMVLINVYHMYYGL